MRIKLIAVGERLPAWVQAGVVEYTARFPREWRFELNEVPVATRGKNPDLARLLQVEGQKMLKAIPERAEVIALDERGETLSTVDWANALKSWQQNGDTVCLLIGGPDGLAPDCRAREQRRWSLSKLTLPHALARVLVVEQLYRAWSLLAGHPYHRV